MIPFQPKCLLWPPRKKLSAWYWEREHQHLNILFFFFFYVGMTVSIHWVELLRLWDFRLHAFVDVNRSLGSQSGEWPMVSYKFDQFWTSSTFKLGGVKCTESLVSCVGEMDEAFGIFQDQIFSTMTEATESLRVLNWTAALSQTHLAFQLRICTPITSSY